MLNNLVQKAHWQLDNMTEILQSIDMKMGIQPEVEPGQLAERNAAFVCFYTDLYKHYAGADKDWGDAALNADVALMGVVMRWNGQLGFPGGKVEDGETLKQAAVRECFEEVGAVVDEDDLHLFCSHRIGEHFNSHLFLNKVTPERLYEIQKEAGLAEHAALEGCGFLVYHVTDKSKPNLLATPAAKTVKEEFECLFDRGVM